MPQLFLAFLTLLSAAPCYLHRSGEPGRWLAAPGLCPKRPLPARPNSHADTPTSTCCLAACRWEANAAALIQLFSSQGVLAEALVLAPKSPPPVPTGRRAFSTGRGRRTVTPSWGDVPPLPLPLTEAPPGSLAALGYAPGPGSADGPPSFWAQRASWCSASGELAAVPNVFLRPIEPVVSPRLVASRQLRSSVLAFAAASAGLHSLQQGAPFAVPLQSVGSLADARWAAWPGRYLVSRKCDGMRCMLVAARDGTPYLLTRAGALYQFPLLRGAAAGGDSAGGGGSASGSSTTAHGAGSSAPTAWLPPGSCLDGELVWVGPPGSDPAARRGFFLAFDALAVGQQQLWKLPLRERLQHLEPFGLAEAESCAALRDATAPGSASAATLPSAAASSSAASSSAAPSSEGAAGGSAAPQLAKKQQAPPPGSDSITVLCKRHRQVSAAALLELEASRPSCPYPTDGLIFTPADFPYSPGTEQLLLKWQPPEQAGADLSGAALQTRLTEVPYRVGTSWTTAGGVNLAVQREQQARALVRRLPTALVYECHQLHPPAEPAVAAAAAEAEATTGDAAAAAALPSRQAERQRREMAELQRTAHRWWLPGSVRWDKRAGNARSVVAALERRAARGHYLSHEMLVGAVQQVQEAAAAQQAQQPVGHPAREVSFEQLQAQVAAEVAAGHVERWVHSASGLEVYCYLQEAGVPSGVAAWCRGLVLHPPSTTLVATPWVRFGDACEAAPGAATAAEAEAAAAGGGGTDSEEEGGEAEAEEAGLLPGSAGDAANLSLYSGGGGGLASASLKLDGSLVVAFKWQGQVYTATRRRMDSEQAGAGRGVIVKRPDSSSHMGV